MTTKGKSKYHVIVTDILHCEFDNHLRKFTAVALVKECQKVPGNPLL